MRKLLVWTGLVCLLVVVPASACFAAGLVPLGKESCICSPLVARGIVPDTLNQLSEAVPVYRLAPILDQIALGVHSIINQFGLPPNGEAPVKQAAVSPPPEPKDKKVAEPPKPEQKKKPAIKKTKKRSAPKRVTDKKKRKGAKAVKKPAQPQKARKIQVPERAM